MMRSYIFRVIALLVMSPFICTCVFADGPGPKVMAKDQFLNPANVKVKGLLGNAMERSEKGRMLSLPGWNDGALIRMFSTESRKKNNTTDWYGEHAGKWMYAAALAVNRTQNETLKALLFQTADYLVSQQEADGYLGSYSEELRITNKNSKQHKKSWDVWSLTYMTLGFLQINEFYPDEKYLTAAKKIGELFLKTFGDGSADLTNYGTRYGMSATVALEAIVELYKTTNDSRYLDFAKLIVREIEQREGLRLVSAGLNNRDMETVADGKAYQVIWNLMALAKLYEVTGENDYIRAVQNAWQNILEQHLTITGGPWGGIGKHKECFNAKGFWDPYGFVETCSTMSWIQLNKQLLHLTGEAKYAQEIEKSTYNSLLASQFPNGEDWSYHTFTNGRRHIANYNDCCPSSGMLTLEELSPLIYTRRDNGIALNLYAENNSTVQLDHSTSVQLSQKTNYPFDGKIILTLTSSQPTNFPLFIRVPEWAENATIKINGKPSGDVNLKKGSYAELKRTWDATTTIEINFPVVPRLVQHTEVAIAPQSTADIYRVEWVALARGPLVYAANGLVNGEDREKNLKLPANRALAFFQPIQSTQWTGPAFRLSTGNVKSLLFVPYFEADGRKAGNWRLTWMQSHIDQ